MRILNTLENVNTIENIKYYNEVLLEYIQLQIHIHVDVKIKLNSFTSVSVFVLAAIDIVACQ